MRILVVQTTRMGDVLQTSPLVRQLRLRHPDAEITLMVRRMGEPIARRHPDADHVLVYNEDEMFLDLVAQDSRRLLDAYRKADDIVTHLRSQKFDIAFNITHSIASAMLLRLAGIPKVIGAHLGADGQFLLRGHWPAYFFTSVYSREYNDLNLCDIMRHFIEDAPPCRELIFELHEEDRQFAADTLAAHGLGENDFLVCMQLGASEENKRWHESRFAALARLLVEKHGARILLVGVKEEAVLGEVFTAHAPGVAVPLYGKTTVSQLAALLARSRLLVTNDTGTMHIAAAVRCPVTLVSVGHVHYRETGPFGEGHCAIEKRRKHLGRSDFTPGADLEREQITPEQVLRAVELTLAYRAGQPVPQWPDEPALSDVDLYTTRFAADGCLQFFPVIRRPLAWRDFVRTAYRSMWISLLNAGREGADGSRHDLLRCFDGPDADEVDAWATDLRLAFAKLAGMASAGALKTRALLKGLSQQGRMSRAKLQVAELMALDEEMRIHSELHPACRPLTLMARFEREALEGAEPLALARRTLEIYQDCEARATMMQRKLTELAAAWRALRRLTLT